MYYVEQLEREWAAWVGAEHAVACSSGTTALHLALESFCFPPESEVIVPDYTMVACARAVTMAGLKPVFVDCGEDLCLNPAMIEQHVSNKTVAIMAVHIYGRCCDMDRIRSIADITNLAVIEDCAEVHGVPLSKQADAYCWSFYQNKIVHGEEGGMIVFRDARRAAIARQLRCQGFTEEHDFFHTPRGINGRLSNANAQLVLQSLCCADNNIAQRRVVEDWYEEFVPNEWKMPPHLVPWVYDLKLPPSANLYSVVSSLNSRGIAARHGFKPMLSQPEYRQSWCGLPSMATAMARRVMYLPIDPRLTRDTIRRSCEALVASVG